MSGFLLGRGGAPTGARGGGHVGAGVGARGGAPTGARGGGHVGACGGGHVDACVGARGGAPTGARGGGHVDAGVGARGGAPTEGREPDRGSVTPLVVGMMVCLLVLTAGVTAAGSAFLAGQRLQRLCDGAVAAAVGAVNPQRTSAQGVAVSDPIAAANEYLRVRGPDVGAVISLGADTVNAQCSNEAPITFGALFGSPTLARTVTSTSEPIRNENALDSSDDVRSFGLRGSLI